MIKLIATKTFVKVVREILTRKEYAEFHKFLSVNPNAGDVIPGGGGIRKVRWIAKGHGKRGGSRIIYVFVQQKNTAVLLYAYDKKKKGDLTKAEVKELKGIAEQYK